MAPTLYPVACQPQAWAGAAPFALLEACLGIACNSQKREIRFHNPLLPRFLEEIIRTDEGAIFGTGMSISQNVSILLLVAAVALWIFILKSPKLHYEAPAIA